MLLLLAQLFVAPSVAGQLATAGGVYNTSQTPSSLPWNTYNYCNAPHVNKAHWAPPNVHGAQLVHVTAMIRHHKRTPDNLFPVESNFNPASGWDCSDFIQNNFGTSPNLRGTDAARISHETDIPNWHPFLPTIWNGTCDEGQLTAGGLQDAVKHGEDFWSVYAPFVGSVTPQTVYVRTSTEDRTYQVAGGMLFGMQPGLSLEAFPVHTQPTSIDSLVPNYPCPAADAIRNAYQSVPAWTDHLQQNAALQARLDAILGTAGLSAWNSWYDHFFDVFTSRTCNDHALPCNQQTGACVAAEDAASVFAIGDFEYNYIWNAAQNASTYTALTFGVMFQELAMFASGVQAGTETFKLRLIVGHDGSMVRLASGLGFGAATSEGRLRWPALGSEIVFEYWKVPNEGLMVRIMHEGTPVQGLDWLTFDDYLAILEKNFTPNLFDVCNS